MSTTASASGSLTSISGHPETALTTSRNHLVAKHLDPVFIKKRSSLSITQPSASPACSLDPLCGRLPPGRLLEYSPSKGETEKVHNSLQGNRHKAARKRYEVRRYKSAEIVDSESGNLDADASDDQHQDHGDPPTTSKRASHSTSNVASKGARQTKSGRASVTPHKMHNRSRMNSLTFAASSSRSTKDMRKRPLTPTAPLGIPKRSKSGPFIVDSSSEDDGDSDDDDDDVDDDDDNDEGDGFSYSAHISVTSKRPERSGTDRVEKLDDVVGSLSSPKASFQQQAPIGAPVRQLTAPKAAPIPYSREGLNRERLKMMLARKRGPVEVQSPTQQKAPMSIGRAGADPRSRPWSGRSFSGDQRTVTEAQNKAGRNISPFARARPKADQAVSSSSREIPSNQVQDTKPSLLSKTTEVPANKAFEPSQASRATIQQPPSLDDTNLKPYAQPAALSRQPNSSTLRTANTAPSHDAANKSSLLNILDTAKAGHDAAAVEYDKIGKEWQKAKIGRVPTKSAKSVKRPEVGARYGHTLTAGKTSDAEKVNMGMADMRAVPADAKAMQVPVSRGQASLRQSRPGSPRAQVETSASRPVPAFGISPVDRTSAEKLRRPAPNARRRSMNAPPNQNPLPATSRNEIPPATISTAEGQGNFRVNNQTRIPHTSSPKERMPVRTFENSNNSSVRDTVDSGNFAKGTAANATWRKSEQSFSDVRASTFSVTDIELPGRQSQKLPTMQPQLSLAFADTGSVNKAQVLVKPSVTSERGISSLSTLKTHANNQRQDNDEAMELSYESSTAFPSGALQPISISTKSRPQRQVPVAVMVRPTREDDAKSLSAGSTVETGLEAVELSKIRLESPDTSLSDHSEAQSSTMESDAQVSTSMPAMTHQHSTNIADNAASDAPDRKGPSADRQGSVRFEVITQTPLPAHVADIALEKQSAEVLEPVVSQSTQSVEIVHEEPTLPVASFQETSQTALIPLRPLNPVSAEEMARLIASATLLSPRPATNSSSLQTLPVSDALWKPQLAPTIATVSTPASASSAATCPGIISLQTPITPHTAEPYFEYTIHQILSSSGSEYITTEISAQPFLSADAANAQTELLFQNAQQQYKYLDMLCKSTTTTVTDHGLVVCEGKFTNIENPSATLTLKIWVAQNVVGVHGSLSSLSHPQQPLLLSRSVYALRLWRLLDVPPSASSSSSASASDSDSDASTTNEPSQCKPRVRTYHPLPSIATELHTTLAAANRAAKRVQLALSHEPAPTKSMQKQWQTQNLRALNRKLEGLGQEVDDDDEGREGGGGGAPHNVGGSRTPNLFEYAAGRRRGCWRSVFNGCELGADAFELLVVRTGISGPRNL
ncbi:uncharacterized protein EKO05_0011240 [Ascochyta rabiei]|uniref:uncharacterized protein n=1 Tax=Didymella rabiei TaxID=5454 RepID=UPI001901F8EC|nr:uncharacterized protein EKO05_0011240 [Ascochyta rabiei]UPX21034.1 hypothetical protein EKO05_0011240 [Ascochyta rabiei]